MKNPTDSDPQAKNELDFLNQYKNKGYSNNFRVENEQLISEENSKYSPKQVQIVAEHRYEGMSNPSDLSILYVVETNDGKKGTIINSYGPSSDSEIHEFIEEIPEENIRHDKSILNL